MNVAEGLVAVLERYGVRHLFGIPGDSINYLMDALSKSTTLHFVHVAHEESGAFAASGQGKYGARLSACMGTSGPGAIHLLNGLYDAQKDGAAVVAITGQLETSSLGLKSHQEVNTIKLFDDVAVYNQTIWDADSALRIMDQACREAISKKGVAHVSLPLNVASQKIPSKALLEEPLYFPATLSPALDAVERAREMIQQAKRPLVLAGLGCLPAREELLSFVQKIKAPVIKTLKAKALLPDEHDFSLGGLGLLGVRPAVSAMEDCDLLLMLGTDFPYSNFLNEKVKTIQVDQNVAALGRRKGVDLAIQGSCADFLREMNKENYDVPADFLESKRNYMKASLRLMDHIDLNFEKEIKPQNLMRLLGQQAPADAVFCCDTGSLTSYFAKSLRVRENQEVYLSGNLATMAFSVSAALGIQLLAPQRSVIALTGDGSMNMLAGELSTVKRLQLPLKIVIMNNSRLHLIDFEENVNGLPQYGTDLVNPDYEILGKAYGIAAKSVSKPEDLERELARALAFEGPYLLDVKVNPEQMLIPPKITFEEAYGFSIAKMKELWEEVKQSFA